MQFHSIFPTLLILHADLQAEEDGSLTWTPSKNVRAPLCKGGVSLTHRPSGTNKHAERGAPTGRTRGGTPGLCLESAQKGPSTTNHPLEDLVLSFTTLTKDTVLNPRGTLHRSSQAVIASGGLLMLLLNFKWPLCIIHQVGRSLPGRNLHIILSTFEHYQ